MDKKNILFSLIAAALFLLFGYFLRETLQYALFWREQQQLFLFDWPYLVENLFRPGGLSILAGGFWVQFFYLPALAVFLTLVLLAVVTLCMWLVVRTMRPALPVYPLSFLPALFLSLSLFDSCFRYEAVTAYLFAALAFYVYSRLERFDWKWRLLTGGLFVLALSYVAGPVTVLFAGSVLLYDILMRREHALCSLLYPFLALLAGYIAVREGAIATCMHAYTPLGYYEMGETMPFFHYLSWFMLPLCLLVAGSLRGQGSGKHRLQAVVSLAFFASALFLFWNKCREIRNPDLHDSYRYEYYAVNEEWGKLADVASANLHTGTALNYLNLALAQQGVLAERLFFYPQYGPNSLVFLPRDKAPDVKLARILFAMGNMAAAQNVAFNTCFTTGGYNPSMLKMILQIDLMRGAYPVARKYIGLLEKSLHYAGWATAQRKFLFDDQAVEADPLLGTGRRDFPREEAFVLSASPMDDLYKVLATNPADGKAMQYALSYLLLAKDFNHVQALIEQYYGAPGLKTLPLPAQEALLFYSDYYHTMDENYALQHGITQEQFRLGQTVDLDYCKAHGVSQETIDRFQRFKEAYGKNRQSPQALVAYRHTFWYYLLFTQI